MKTYWIGPIIAGALLVFGLGVAFTITLGNFAPYHPDSFSDRDEGLIGEPGRDREEEIPSTPAPKTRAGLQTADLKLSGPFTHQNLTVFLVHGKDQIPDKDFLTLQEALEQKKAVVHETGEVSALAIENLSERHVVFVQAGDIVKGGQQDRVVPYDYVVPPNSGRLPLASFCVEHGRWTQRGEENAKQFDSSTAILATKELKLAARYRKAQDEVWAKVDEIQEKLAQNLRGKVRSDLSSSSLQLSLENAKVQTSADAYVERLGPITAGKKDVIGIAFAINGKINSAEVYGSHALFQKVWPRLVRACAIEALTELDKEQTGQIVTAAKLRTCLTEVDEGNASQQQVTERIVVVLQETGSNLLFETRDGRHKDAWVHRSYFTK
jgi:hypothetical protein